MISTWPVDKPIAESHKVSITQSNTRVLKMETAVITKIRLYQFKLLEVEKYLQK
jgi:hypothetical protein